MSGKYFYDPAGKPSEPLFSALLCQLGSDRVATKEAGLLLFQRAGRVLVDATYEPVNDGRSKAERDRTIERGYPLLRADLDSLTPDRSAPLILIKANVCRVLEPRLAADRFIVLNRGRAIYFPSSGRQPDFARQFRDVIRDVPTGVKIDPQKP
jgi:hypothetical protein